jgi:quercetin dioxygenase-like cupin family protein
LQHQVSFDFMKLIKHDPASALASPAPVIIGHVANQVLVGEIDATNLRVTSVTFHDGARNLPHRHSCDQVLVVTDGHGIIATEYETHEVTNGDVVVIPAGDVHWHGALPGMSMTHLSIVTPHETEFAPEAIATGLEFVEVVAP